MNDENGDLIPLTDSVAPMNIAGIDTYAGHTFKIMEAGSTTGLLFTKAATKEKIAIGYMDNIGLTLSHRYDIREIGSPRGNIIHYLWDFLMFLVIQDSRNKTTSGLQPLREYTPSTITLMVRFLSNFIKIKSAYCFADRKQHHEHIRSILEKRQAAK